MFQLREYCELIHSHDKETRTRSSMLSVGRLLRGKRVGVGVGEGGLEGWAATSNLSSFG
jgi:hypothetical protein